MFIAYAEHTNRGAQPALARRQQMLDDQAARQRAETEAIARQRAELAARKRSTWEETARIARQERINGVYSGRVGRLEKIITRICRAMKVSRREVLSPRRNIPAVLARQAIMYWAYRLTTLSLPQIGRRLGDRDHTTVLHALRAYPVKRAKMGRTLRKAR